MVPSNLSWEQQDARLSNVFDIQMHYGDAAACLLTLFRTLQLQKVKLAVKGHHFESTEDIQRAVPQALNDIPQSCVTGMLQIMAALLGKLCAGTRDEL